MNDTSKDGLVTGGQGRSGDEVRGTGMVLAAVIALGISVIAFPIIATGAYFLSRLMFGN